MDTNKERLRFFLPSKYFNGTRSQSSNGMSRTTCIRVLYKAFGLCEADWNRIICEHSDGLEIVCRPSQFARFIVYRHEADECINGIKDLKPKLFKHEDLYEKLGRQFSLPVGTVKGLARALGYANGDEGHISHRPPGYIDVTSEPGEGRC